MAEETRDMSKSTFTPQATDRVLVMDKDDNGGHETLSSIKDFVNTDNYTKSEVDAKLALKEDLLELGLTVENGLLCAVYAK